MSVDGWNCGSAIKACHDVARSPIQDLVPFPTASDFHSWQLLLNGYTLDDLAIMDCNLSQRIDAGCGQQFVSCLVVAVTDAFPLQNGQSSRLLRSGIYCFSSNRVRYNYIIIDYDCTEEWVEERKLRERSMVERVKAVIALWLGGLDGFPRFWRQRRVPCSFKFKLRDF